MSYPPGTPGPDDPDGGHEARDPWATPSSGQPSTPPPPPYGQPPQQPAYGPPQYGQPPYGQPQYGYAQRTNGKATAALWTGVGSIVLTPCCGLGIIGLLPIVLGVKARAEIRAAGGQQEGDGMALAGIITGATAIVLSIAVIVILVVAIANGTADFTTTSESGV